MTPGTNDVNIRRRNQDDFPSLARVLIRVHDLDGYPVEGVSDPQAWLKPPREIAAWTALLADEPVGHISLTEGTADDDAAQVWLTTAGGNLSDVAVVVRLFVDPPHRGRGAGQDLMRAAHEHASAIGKQLVFDVMLKDDRAIRLYERLGCQRLGLISHKHGDGLEEPAAVYVAPAATPQQ